MKYLNDIAEPGDLYAVEFAGKLIPVAAPNLRDAIHMATLAEFGPNEAIPPVKPKVYRLDPEGEPMEVFL